MNPHSTKYESIFLFHALGTCLRPLKALCNLYNFLVSSCITNPRGCVTYTTSSRGPLKNVDFYLSEMSTNLVCMPRLPPIRQSSILLLVYILQSSRVFLSKEILELLIFPCVLQSIHQDCASVLTPISL